MKTFLLFFCLIALFQAHQFPPRILQILRVLSAECNYHGYLYKNKCYCESQWRGSKCEIQSNEKHNNFFLFLTYFIILFF